MENSPKEHWEKIYETKQPNEVSWTQDIPQTSLDFIHSFGLPTSARIIDIGGGDSKLVDHLLAEGFTDITVLDISAASLERAKKRLGDKASAVNWIVSDIKEFVPNKKYDLWHDRAAFHFLTEKKDVMEYLSLVRKAVDGYMIVGTFSPDGPTKCSGLSIKQYSDEELTAMFMDGFEKIKCVNVDHTTPFNTHQNFTFCSFRHKAA
jgi:trans-aconitate methyltransferase